MSNWKPGDVVVLRSGGPPMTVSEPSGTPGGHPGHRVRCLWFTDNRLERGEFPPETLVPSPERASASAHGSGNGNGARIEERPTPHG